MTSRYALIGLFLAACHPEPFSYTAPDVGPATTGTDVQLTFNEVNYWPTLTEDGTGIVYAFVDESEPADRPINNFEQPPFVVVPLHVHRCMGEIPVRGGTRHWEFCDKRATELDSLNSFTAFAMRADGRLLYTESTTPRRSPFQPARVSLWLADSATPFRRTLLARFPATVGDSVVDWVADLKWTGPNTFLAIGQRLLLLGHGASSLNDSVFTGQTLMRGTIDGGSATLTAIAGTRSITAYAVVDNGAAVVFAQRDSTRLKKVPLAGGAVSVIITGVAPSGSQIVGISCRDLSCVAATASGPASGPFQLRSISLATGAVTTVYVSGQPLGMPLLAATGNVVAKVGPGFGRLGTFQATNLSLHLFKGLFP